MFLKYYLKGQIKSCIGKTQFIIKYNQLVDSYVVCQVAENTLDEVTIAITITVIDVLVGFFSWRRSME